MQQLEEMSTSDMLTGVFNRNAMLRRMDELISRDGGEPFGIINLDLNGLKVVNDRDGHDAGDALLAQAAGVLKKVFRRGDLFRAGGDEFIVIAEGVSQEVFERKVQEFLDEVERQPHVSFAWGACWSGEVENAREVFLKADERMYLNKRAYYQSHPELTVR